MERHPSVSLKYWWQAFEIVIIGYTNPGYPVVRSILNCCEGVRYVRSRSFESAIAKIRRLLKLPNRGLLKTGCTYLGGAADSRVDLFHFFNLISCGCSRRPFVTTFETSVPRDLERGDYWHTRALEAIASDRCKRLMALSDCTRKIQENVFRDCGLGGLARKVVVLHPPQRLISTKEEVRQKAERIGNDVHFLFVGRAFWRKGGGEAVRALARIRKSYPVRLTLIGDVDYADYTSDASVDSSVEMYRLIDRNRDWIHWARSMPNEELLRVMKGCDVGLLPTRADTYGYSVLEMQAAGLPCITTDVRALPEINPCDCGWQIGVRKNKFGEAYYADAAQIRSLSETIELGLEAVLESVLQNRAEIGRKAILAHQRVARAHSARTYGQALKRIYEESL